MLQPTSADSSGAGRTASTPRSLVDSALELVGLWTLAILQPLVELIGRDAPFLLHHRPDAVDLTIVLVAIALGPPALLLLLEGLVGRIAGAAARERAHRAALATLAVLMLLGALRKLGDPLAPWVLLPVVGALWWLASIALRRWPTITGLFRVASLALPIVVTLFWISPGARAARATTGADSGPLFPGTRESGATAVTQPATADLPPVVWVIFDELPLLSILDAELGIDRHLCPNLAAFAETSTWYRNATTAWSSTGESIVTILTGRVGEPHAPPTRDRYPHNLLTWLAPSHEVRAFESVTSLAPATAIELLPRPRRATRLSGLLLDSFIVTVHLVTPPELGFALPPIDNRWGGFFHRRVVRGRQADDEVPAERTPWTFALADARAGQFSAFLRSIAPTERPGLFFAHFMLPHMPYRYLPSGRVYGGRPVYEKPATAWLENDWFALETYQRHILQVGYIDRLVGDLRTRLEEIGLWDRAVVVLTSDHGVSHWPGQDRRLPLETDHPDDLLRVPLFIKAPHQVEGRVDDRPASTMDAIPTVAELLGLPLGWSPDGIRLNGDREIPAETVLRDPQGNLISFDAALAPDRESLARKLELFDPQAGPWRFVRLGPYRDLVGGPVGPGAEFRRETADCRGVIDQLPVLQAHDPSSRFSPALLTGEIECAEELPAEPYVAVAINGWIAGTARVQEASPTSGLYSVMTAEAALEPGRNEVRLLLLSGPPKRPVIEPVEIAAAAGSS